MKTKFFGLILAGLMFVTAPAHAALLSVVGGGATVLPGDFALPIPGLTPGVTSITEFTSASAANTGLFIDQQANLKFEFLGSDADFTNTLTVLATEIFSTATATPGDMAAGSTGPGTDFLVPFILSNGLGGTATNGGPISPGLSFAFANITGTSVILLFDDGGGIGRDFNDLAVRISVSQVPLPAAAWLLISAILGLVSFSRIRRTRTQTA